MDTAQGRHTFHTPLPKGQAGEFSYHVPFSNLVMGYSKNQKAAKDFLRWICSKEIYDQWFTSQQGFSVGSTAQLQAFRDKTRADPHAQTYMWGMAARLSDPTIDAIAAYYASQTPVAGQPSDSPETVAGKKIFTEGIPSESVPACMACHGENAEVNGPIPRLAGQHQAYLARQLEAFASMARANEIMHENSKGLTAEQIRDVAAFVQTQ